MEFKTNMLMNAFRLVILQAIGAYIYAAKSLD